MYVPVAVAALFLLQVVGSETSYTIQTGDSLTKIGARFGVSPESLADANGLKLSTRLQIGQPLRINNRHIVPSVEGARIVVNIPQRMLFWVSSDKTIEGFPIAAGKRGWKTPVGDFTVASREVDPTWDVPLSIQAEMQREGKPVLTRVPASPQNPLGKYWIGLTIPNVGIHGTNAPASIYSLVTHGCIRLNPEDIEQLFSQIEIGMRGRIIYETVLIAREGDSLFLEVHPDTYGRAPEPMAIILERARMGGYLDMLDLTRVAEDIRKLDGVLRDVTRR